ncbi:MAG: ETX/MTX2 family pore-forming toxin [Planctomycetes bacterium]|nr:ETX/MTX2 family pore-forming toxin [Planctomycetota bacterium]
MKTYGILLGIALLWGDCPDAQGAASYKYFRIYDAAHTCYLASGASFDGNIYHLRESELGDHASWRFEPAGDGYYYIIDRRHGGALCGGDTYDGQTYAVLDHANRLNAQWKAVEGSVLGAFFFFDRKHDRALVAGDTYNGDVYHQVPGDRTNAQWILRMIADGDEGPHFYVIEQRLLGLDMHDDLATRLETPPLFVIGGQRIQNDTSVQQTFTISRSKTDITKEAWSFSRAVKVGIHQSFEVSASVEGIVDAKTKTEFSYEETNEWGKSGSSTTEHQISWEIPVVVPPRTVIAVDGIVSRFETEVPFTASIRTTFADGTQSVDDVDGTWSGVEYVTGSVTYSEIPDTAGFMRGDTDGDGTYTIGDGIQVLEMLFADRTAFTSNCMDTGDLDDNGQFTVGDAIWLFNYLFTEGPLKKPPYLPADVCGVDPTPDTSLGCEGYPIDHCP